MPKCVGRAEHKLGSTQAQSSQMGEVGDDVIARDGRGKAALKPCKAKRKTNRQIPECDIVRFLEALAETSNIAEASRQSGINRETIRRWRGSKPDFAARFDQALREGVLDLKIKALHQARFGVRSVETTEEKDGVKIRTVVRDAALSALREVERLHHDALAEGAARGVEAERLLDHRLQQAFVKALAHCFMQLLREQTISVSDTAPHAAQPATMQAVSETRIQGTGV